MAIALATWLALLAVASAAAPAPPLAAAQRPAMRRLGSYDIDAGESTPLLWRGSLLLLETIHVGDATTKARRVPAPPAAGEPPLPRQNATYLRIRKFPIGGAGADANALVVPKIPGSEGVSFGSARVVKGGAAVWVFGTRNNTQILAFWSEDPGLVRWQSSVAKHMPKGCVLPPPSSLPPPTHTHTHSRLPPPSVALMPSSGASQNPSRRVARGPQLAEQPAC